MTNFKFKSYTAGLNATHDTFKKRKLVRVEFSESDCGTEIKLEAVGGNNLEAIKKIPPVVISRKEWDESPYDPYNSTVEAIWALGKLGCEV